VFDSNKPATLQTLPVHGQPIAIRKAAHITGKTLVFRDAVISDASFILSLRTDSQKARHLTAVSGNLKDQVAWLERYGSDPEQAYFIIEHKGEEIGTVRLYDSRGDSFCWGSWILKDGRPNHAAMESALMVYAFSIDHLGFKRSHFDVRKGNERVWQFHERFGARRVEETDKDYLYELDLQAIRDSRKRYERFLQGGVIAEFI
jgi:RimJ/RimL family protein N-acetyltransferase